RPPFSASTNAYTRAEFDGATATPTLPQTPSGRPFFFESFFSDTQVSPPSRETERSPPGPPLVNSHGRRRACQNPAKTIRGLFGSRARSDAPVSSFLESTFCHVFPPSVVR